MRKIIVFFVEGGKHLTIQDEIQEASDIKVNKQVIKKEKAPLISEIFSESPGCF